MYNVLIVDDESMVRLGMKNCVDWQKLHVENIYEAANGEEGLQMVRDHKVDVVITDLKMSVMDGFSFLEKLQRMEPSPQAIVMSCYNDYENMRRALKLHVKDFLFKPRMYPKDIEEAVAKVLDGLEQEEPHFTEDSAAVTEENYRERFLSLCSSMPEGEKDAGLSEAKERYMDFANRIMYIDHSANEKLNLLSGLIFRRIQEVKKCESLEELRSVFQDIAHACGLEENKGARQAMARAMAYIDENLADPNLSMEAAADYVGLSVSYFSRTFKAAAGKGYTDYVADKRIEMADRLYQTTDLKIYEIAERVGYTNPKYFSKVYKEHTGKNMKKHNEPEA